MKLRLALRLLVIIALVFILMQATVDSLMPGGSSDTSSLRPAVLMYCLW